VLADGNCRKEKLMATKKANKVVASRAPSPNKVYMTNSQFKTMRRQVNNEMLTMHREVLNRILTTQTNVDTACGYPDVLTTQDYKTMFDRNGLAKRAIQIWPEESWQSFPDVYETENPEVTPFEKAWRALEIERSLYSTLYRADILSGIGSFGIVVLGLDDGGDLDKPVEGINEKTGERTGDAKERKLLYLRVYDESMVTVEALETDPKSPRHGMPVTYNITFKLTGKGAKATNQKIHWTRILHLADNRESSEIYGIPRLQSLYNNLYDVKKVSGGSGEMFWKGGFPGYAFELTPEAITMGAEMDAESIKEQMLLWSQGLQRWIALQGVTTKSLAAQVSDPTGHVDVHFKLIAVSLGVPYRVLLGSEEAKLASTQDKRTWNNRVARRQNFYLTPMVLRPFIDRLIALGCLPQPKEYSVKWPDLNAATDDDIAKVALNRTEAFAKYTAGGVAALISPRQYLTQIHKLGETEVEAIMKDQTKLEVDMDPEPEPESKPKAPSTEG
jgi:hypothetical protein